VFFVTRLGESCEGGGLRFGLFLSFLADGGAYRHQASLSSDGSVGFFSVLKKKRSRLVQGAAVEKKAEHQEVPRDTRCRTKGPRREGGEEKGERGVGSGERKGGERVIEGE